LDTIFTPRAESPSVSKRVDYGIVY